MWVRATVLSLIHPDTVTVMADWAFKTRFLSLPYLSARILNVGSLSLTVSRFGLAVRRWAGKRRDLGSNPLRLSFLFKRCGLWTLSCGFVLHNYETLKWLSSLPPLIHKSFWWWQCSDRYIISPTSPFSPSLINLWLLWTLSTMFTYLLTFLVFSNTAHMNWSDVLLPCLLVVCS